MLQLTRPIAFIDLETTGVNLSTDRIVEIAIVKLLTDGSRQVKRKLINPQIPIPAATTEIQNRIIKTSAERRRLSFFILMTRQTTYHPTAYPPL